MKTAKALFLIGALLSMVASSCGNKPRDLKTMYLSSDTSTAVVYAMQEDKTLVPCDTLVRGAALQLCEGASVKFEKSHYEKVRIGKDWRYVHRDALVEDLSSVAKETVVYVRTPASVIDDTLSSHITALARKGAAVEVLGFDKVDAEGLVRRYRVKVGEKEGYLYGKYTVFTEDEAQQRYMPEVYDVHHSKVRNSFGAGEAVGCDFFPVKKPVFENNRMPEACYSLYLTISPAGLKNIDSYIALAKTTRINTFVIDIKDDTAPGFKAEAMEKYSPTSFAHAGGIKEQLYTDVVAKLHEQGFYVAGRITCFKDTYFVKDNPSTAITERATGKPFYHNRAYWPSAYDRKVWQYNVELAKEAVSKFKLDEINFDYVRFPDRMQSVENQIDYHNRYGETKVQAIQRFVQYACDEIHALGAYVSIDVFGETANIGYTTAYGQYWPALSNIADAICGMPYPDHFADHYYGISKPWNHPYEILSAWGRRVMVQQGVTPTPAKVRTWVQCYHVMKHVDPNGIDYLAENVEKEIRGLYSAGLRDGYVTWLSSGNLERYTKIAPAFKVDYLKEYPLTPQEGTSDPKPEAK